MNEAKIDSMNSDAQSMGISDAQFENGAFSCNSSTYSEDLTILDFGQPKYNEGHYGNGSWNWIKRSPPALPYRTYTEDEQVVENYVNSWLTKANTCQYLTLVMGVNNSNMCWDVANGMSVGTCDTNNGNALAIAAQYLESIYASDGNVTIVGGSDIEVESGWDIYSGKTYNWMSGFYNAGTGEYMYDYGDTCNSTAETSCPNSPTWTQCEVYQAAWGYGYDMAEPEIYSSNSASYWAFNATGLTPSKCSGYIADNEQFGGIANRTNIYNWSTAMTTFRNDLASDGYSNAIISPSDTCFPDINDNYPTDPCYP